MWRYYEGVPDDMASLRTPEAAVIADRHLWCAPPAAACPSCMHHRVTGYLNPAPCVSEILASMPAPAAASGGLASVVFQSAHSCCQGGCRRPEAPV